MLVIARRAQESLIIPSARATIQVVAIRSGSVRLGVEAPPEVKVYREELYERLKETDAGAAPLDSPPLPDAGSSEHQVRNHLNNITLALGMLRRQLGASLTAGVQALLDAAAGECVALRQQLAALLGGEAGSETQTPVQPSLNGAGI
jgi:carbon storage regulator CsrA